MQSPEDEKAYVPFLTNRSLSYFADTIFLASEMNLLPGLSHRAQYDFYLHTVRKRKRYAKWPKTGTLEELEAVMEYFDINKDKARETMRLLSQAELDELKTKSYLGGRD